MNASVIFKISKLNRFKFDVLKRYFCSPTAISAVGKHSSEISEGSAKTDVAIDDQPPNWEDGPLAEFFDLKDNWAKVDVITGRSWRLDELRIKKNSDLHKLWYVLLKERNMLKTMEASCEKYFQPMPCPERIYKVEESMENLERVIAERNSAFIELETGETGERPSKYFTTILGFRDKRFLDEHSKPAEAKEKLYEQPYLDDEVYMFQKLWKEKLLTQKRDKEDDEKRVAGKHKRWHRK